MMDVTHARINLMGAIAPYVEDEEGQGGVLASLDARSVMLDGLYRAVYGDPSPVAGRLRVVPEV